MLKKLLGAFLGLFMCSQAFASGPFVIGSITRLSPTDTYPIVTRYSAAYTVATSLNCSIDTALFNAGTATIAETLPQLSTVPDGCFIVIQKDENSVNAVTVTPFSGDSFDTAQTSYSLNYIGENIVLQASANLAKWIVVSSTSSTGIVNDSSNLAGNTVTDALNNAWNSVACTNTCTSPTVSGSNNSTANATTAWVKGQNYIASASPTAATCGAQLATSALWATVPTLSGACTITLPAVGSMGTNPVLIDDVNGQVTVAHPLTIQANSGDTITTASGAGLATATSITYTTPLMFITYRANGTTWNVNVCDSSQACLALLVHPPFYASGMSISSGCGGGTIVSNGTGGNTVTTGALGGSTCAVQFPKNASGYACQAYDITNYATVELAVSLEQVNSNNVIETFTGIQRGTAGTPITNWATSDKIKILCITS